MQIQEAEDLCFRGKERFCQGSKKVKAVQNPTGVRTQAFPSEIQILLNSPFTHDNVSAVSVSIQAMKNKNRK